MARTQKPVDDGPYHLSLDSLRKVAEKSVKLADVIESHLPVEGDRERDRYEHIDYDGLKIAVPLHAEIELIRNPRQDPFQQRRGVLNTVGPPIVDPITPDACLKLLYVLDDVARHYGWESISGNQSLAEQPFAFAELKPVDPRLIASLRKRAQVLQETVRENVPMKSDSGGNGKKNINARMLEKLQDGEWEHKGWSCTQWAKHLKCSRAAVTKTDTWKELSTIRGKLKAEKAQDKRGRNVHKKNQNRHN